MPYNAVFNGSNQAVEFSSDALNARRYRQHRAQRWSLDRVAASASYRRGKFTVPAMTTAVFVGY